MSAEGAADAEQETHRAINEEYKIWKKNAPFLYDVILTHALEWPSLTVEWFPEMIRHSGRDEEEEGTGAYQTLSLALGTHTSEQEQNYLMKCNVHLPLDTDAGIDPREYNHQKGGLGLENTSKGAQVGSNLPSEKFETVLKINHAGDINKARHCPQHPTFIASKPPSGKVLLFDYSKHDSIPDASGVCRPDVVLAGHTREGYGLDWSSKRAGYIASGADDGVVCVWDVRANVDESMGSGNGSAAAGGEVSALTLLRNAHGGAVVGDVAFHKFHDSWLGSVGDDGRFCLWDLRHATSGDATTGGSNPSQSIVAHGTAGNPVECNTLSFSPFSEYFVLTGGADGSVNLFDLRRMSSAVHTFAGHTAEVFSVEWSPFHETVLASAGSDRRVHVWDLARVGEDQSAEDAADGVPELLFVHGGHTAKVSDISWSPNIPWLMASVAEDNIVQIWLMAENIYHDVDEDVPETVLE